MIHHIKSESIAATMAYDDHRECLDVSFSKSGRSYRYLNVGKSVYKSLQAAPIKDAFFQRFIQKNYQCVRTG